MNKIFSRKPSSWHGEMWREGYPIGNGELGGLVYGFISHEIILLNHHNIWYGGKVAELPDVSYLLPKIRRSIDEGDYAKANELYSKELARLNYDTQLEYPMPLVDINIKTAIKKPFSNYKRSLNFESGECEVCYNEEDNKIIRKAFIPRGININAIKITATKSIDCDIWLDLHKGTRYKMEKINEEFKDKFKFYSGDNLICLKYLDNKVNTSVITDGEIELLDNKFIVKSAKKIEIFTAINEKISNDLTYDKLYKKHIKLHNELYSKSKISLCNKTKNTSNEELLYKAYCGKVSTELIQKMYNFGKYLFICGTSEKSNPFSLYGLWGGDYYLPWALNMANENIQMCYWSAPANGLANYLKSFINYYYNNMDKYKENAKKLYGARGIYIPAGTSPNVHIASLTAYGVIVNWTGAAAWIAQHFYEYYKFTKDEEMLNEKIIPFLKEVALFYEDFLVEKDGVYISYPSVSPENTPANFINNNNCKDGFDLMAHQMPVVKNATMDFALIKEVITNLIECSVDIEKYSKMLSKIPNYKVNDDGAICEWIDEDLKDNYRHRHIPHLYPVFPGKENVGRNLKKAFKKALDLREMGGQTGWSLCHSSCVYSRLQEPQQAYKCLEILLKSCVMDNFFTNHNDYRQMGQTVDMWDWAPQQLDANLGFVQAIHEMLIYFDNDSIKILPSCPFDFGNVSNINTPFGEISFRWNKDDVKIEINSTVNRKVKIIILDKSSDYLLKKGEKTCITKME